MCICGAPRTRGARSHAFIPHDSAPQILSASTRLPPLAGRASAAASSENPRHPTHPRPGVLTAAKPAARLATVFYFFACRRCECRPRGCRAAGVRFWALAPWIRVCRPTGTCSCPRQRKSRQRRRQTSQPCHQRRQRDGCSHSRPRPADPLCSISSVSWSGRLRAQRSGCAPLSSHLAPQASQKARKHVQPQRTAPGLCPFCANYRAGGPPNGIQSPQL